MTAAVPYYPEDNLWGHFVSHAHLGLSKHIQPHRMTIPERIGNIILWTVEDMPGLLWDKIKDARVVTVAMTALALLANSFLFYPTKTWLNLKAFIRWIPKPPLWAIRFASYIFTCALIIGYGLRAYGRFSNHELMNEFYHPRAADGSSKL
jgi:hypothetical protein